MTIVTNNVPRNLTYGYELTAKEREDFDYIDAEEFDSHDFVKYRNRIYDIHEFTAITEGNGYYDLHALGWQGIITDSFFSGILLKYDGDDMDKVIMGLVLS